MNMWPDKSGGVGVDPKAGGGGVAPFATAGLVISPLPSKYLVGTAPENAEINPQDRIPPPTYASDSHILRPF